MMFWVLRKEAIKVIREHDRQHALYVGLANNGKQSALVRSTAIFVVRRPRAETQHNQPLVEP
jgi:hypothetical protein